MEKNSNKKISIWQKLNQERENGRKKFRKDGLWNQLTFEEYYELKTKEANRREIKKQKNE